MKLTHGHSHGGANNYPTKTYRTWVNMKSRCDNPGATAYEYYGGRGISYCERWKDFSNFLEDMGLKPMGMTLERKDPLGNYSPENCRWATKQEQAENKGIYANNTSGVKGVSWDKSKKVWVAYKSIGGVRRVLYSGGFFEKAVAARKEADNKGA